MNEFMKTPLVKMLLWQNLEFRTSLSLTTCEKRLDDMGASLWLAGKKQGLFAGTETSFFLRADRYSFSSQIGISGSLQETQTGTLVKYSFSHDRTFSNYSVLIFLLIFLLYKQSYGFALLLIVVAAINAAYIYYNWSTWEYLENRIRKELLHWKKG